MDPTLYVNVLFNGKLNKTINKQNKQKTKNKKQKTKNKKPTTTTTTTTSLPLLPTPSSMLCHWDIFDLFACPNFLGRGPD